MRQGLQTTGLATISSRDCQKRLRVTKDDQYEPGIQVDWTRGDYPIADTKTQKRQENQRGKQPNVCRIPNCGIARGQVNANSLYGAVAVPDGCLKLFPWVAAADVHQKLIIACERNAIQGLQSISDLDARLGGFLLHTIDQARLFVHV